MTPMRFSVDISGLQHYADAMQNIDKALGAVAAGMETEMKTAITGRRSQGRSYKRRDGRVHVASTAGNPPNNDYGKLAGSIQQQRISATEDGVFYEVSVATEYALPLEFGTSRTAARPFVMPAVKKWQPIMISAVRKIMAGHGI